MEEYRDEEVEIAMELLGVDPRMLRASLYNARLLDALKRSAKRAWRACALELHPDKTGNDPEKTRLFKLVTDVLSQIEDLRAEENPRQVKWALHLVNVEVA